MSYDFFGRRMAVEVSLGPGPGGSPLGLAMLKESKSKEETWYTSTFIVSKQKGTRGLPTSSRRP